MTKDGCLVYRCDTCRRTWYIDVYAGPEHHPHCEHGSELLGMGTLTTVCDVMRERIL